MNQGIRNNQGKPQWSQIDFKAIEPMVAVLTYGESKVGRDNWRKGLLVRETIESLLRHTFSLLAGEDNDQESQLPHIGHILSNAMFISYMLQNRPDMDNRQKRAETHGVSNEELEKYGHDRLLEMLKSHGVSYEEWCNKTEGMLEEEKNKVLMSSIPQFWKFEKKEEPKGGVLDESNFRQIAHIEKYREDFPKVIPRSRLYPRTVEQDFTLWMERAERAQQQNANIGRSYPKEVCISKRLEIVSNKIACRLANEKRVEGNQITRMVYGRWADFKFSEGKWWEIIWEPRVA